MVSDLKINIQSSGTQPVISNSVKNSYPVFTAKMHTQPNTDRLELSDSRKNKRKNNTFKAVCIGLGLAALATAGILLMTKGKNISKKLAQQYEQDCALLKKFKTTKSEHAGDTIQKTITNILGENSTIKPHNYDIAQEYPVVVVCRSVNGYKYEAVGKTGILENTPGVRLPRIVSKSIHEAPNEVHFGDQTRGIVIRKGTVGDLDNKVVCLEIKDDECMTPGAKMAISFISPTAEFTPLQKDVMKLAEHPEKLEIDVFKKILQFKNPLDDNGHVIRENVGIFENLDYDLILSAIQSMVK